MVRECRFTSTSRPVRFTSQLRKGLSEVCEARGASAALMDDYLGFRRLAGLRHIASFRGQWSGGVTGPSSAATGGWKPEQQWLDLTTRDCVRRRERFRTLPPSFLRRGGWPTTGPAATRWRRRSAIRRVLRAQGGGLACQGVCPRQRALHRPPMARRFSLCGATAAVAGAAVACLLAPRGSEVMRSLHDELAAIEDFRRAGSTRCAHVLAELANMKGSCAVCAVAVPGRGHRRNPRTELREPPSRATLHRAVDRSRGARGCARPPARPGANRNGDHETVALTPPAHPSRC